MAESEYTGLDEIPSDKELYSIAGNIGHGWQLLASYLGIDHTQVDQIEQDYRHTVERIFRLLVSWKQLRADRATLRALFYQMHQTGHGLNWSREGIAASLNLKESDIRDCKHSRKQTDHTDFGGQHVVKAKLQPSGVPVQQQTQGQLSVTSSCDTNQSRLNADIFTNIINAFKRSKKDIKAYDVARLVGLGNTASRVNMYLYCLEKHGVLSKNDNAQWNLVREPSGDELEAIRAELAERPNAKPKTPASQPSTSQRSASLVSVRPAPPAVSRAVGTDIFTKIINAFKQSNEDIIKAKDVAQLVGLGNTASRVNRYLYCLERHGVLSNNDKAQWKLVREPSGDELEAIRAELAERPNAKPKTSSSQPSTSQQSASLDTSIDRQEMMEVITIRTAETSLQFCELSTNTSLENKRKQLGYRSPKDACFYDGRLILLSKEDKDYIKGACTPDNEIGKGGFGTVYKQSNDGFGMQIAIKKITAKSEELNSARKEMFASRILYPFILPLLATFEEGGKDSSFDIFFISPYCENGDLNTVLKRCRETPDTSIRINQTQRIRICLQVALAIQYLHTPVPNVRGVILHKDISSVNIVLDKHLNARLIDFGLAREKDDITSRCSGKTPYQHPDTGSKPTSALWDIYSFGVVIRELLTSLPPTGKHNVYLKFMSADLILKNLAPEWPKDDDDSLKNALVLNTVSTKCLKAEEDKFCIKTDVIGAIKNIFRQRIIDVPESDRKNCQSCMINPKGSEAANQVIHKSNCKEPIILCIACEKNSFLNPVICYSCEVKMEPIIGGGWGALLVAGNDTDDDNNAKAFKQDMEKVKRILVSRAPLIMGISQEKVQTVAMEKPGRAGIEEKLLPRVEAAIEELKKTKVRTLVVYFSCHGGKNGDNFFQLASKEEKLTMKNFENMLASLSTVEKVIIILDRCCADAITVTGKSVVQINASRSNESAPVQPNGSPFTKFLIQGLKAESEGKSCNTCEDKCKHCVRYRATRNDYITVGSLLDYVANHMKSECHPEPYCLFKGTSNDEKLAYYTEEEVLVEFSKIEDGKQKDESRHTQTNVQQLPIAFCENMDELRTQLLTIFKLERTDLDVHIKNDTYRKDKRLENCKDIAEVMMAWVLRKPLFVQFSERGSI